MYSITKSIYWAFFVFHKFFYSSCSVHIDKIEYGYKLKNYGGKQNVSIKKCKEKLLCR